MIVWRGNGGIGLIPLLGVPILSVIVGTLLMDQQRRIARVLPFFDDQAAGFTALTLMVLGCFLGGLLTYMMGKGWNRMGGTHDVYFIPIDFLGFIVWAGSGSFLLFMAGLVVLGQLIRFFK
jgi:hypothetical protein